MGDRTLHLVLSGDQVTATYQSAAALEILPANSGAPGVETTEGTSAAPKGAKPGMEGQQSVTVNSKLTAIDMKEHTVTLREVVSSFQGQRHVRAALVNENGKVIVASGAKPE